MVDEEEHRSPFYKDPRAFRFNKKGERVPVSSNRSFFQRLKGQVEKAKQRSDVRKVEKQKLEEEVRRARIEGHRKGTLERARSQAYKRARGTETRRSSMMPRGSSTRAGSPSYPVPNFAFFGIPGLAPVRHAAKPKHPAGTTIQISGTRIHVSGTGKTHKAKKPQPRKRKTASQFYPFLL